VPTRFRFAGMDFDSDTNMYHTWFREYDSAQGRWMSTDPLPGHADDPQTRNRYIYVRNDPVNLIDPLGLDWLVTECERSFGTHRQEGFPPEEIPEEIHCRTYPIFVGGGGGNRPVVDPWGGGGGGQGGPPNVPFTPPPLPFNFPMPQPPPPLPCWAMAANAQIVMDAALSTTSSAGAALAQFDANFSKLYIGSALTNIFTAASIFARPSLPNRTIPSVFFGQSDFQSQFREPQPTDQTHHFAAYLSVGINSNGRDWLNVQQTAHAWRDSPADQVLEKAAFDIGQRLQSLGRQGLKGIGDLIRSIICK
jgi:RHS repeat-associated protein